MSSKNKAVDTHFYYLVAAQLKFITPDDKGEDQIGADVVNCVIWTDLDKLPVSSIGRAQQLAQMNFYKKVPDPTQVKIVDVIILNLIPLGRFTEAEFNKTPQGMAVQEQDKQALDAVFGNA